MVFRAFQLFYDYQYGNTDRFHMKRVREPLILSELWDTLCTICRSLLRQLARLAWCPHVILIVSAMALTPTAQASTTAWSGYLVGRIFAPDDRPCLFFELSGVPQADPLVPGNSWMAVPQSQDGYQEIYALLLWAKATGTPISAVTSGQLAASQCLTHGNIVGVYQDYSAS